MRMFRKAQMDKSLLTKVIHNDEELRESALNKSEVPEHLKDKAESFTMGLTTKLNNLLQGNDELTPFNGSRGFAIVRDGEIIHKEVVWTS